MTGDQPVAPSDISKGWSFGPFAMPVAWREGFGDVHPATLFIYAHYLLYVCEYINDIYESEDTRHGILLYICIHIIRAQLKRK